MNKNIEIKKVDYFEFDKICREKLTATQERVYRCLLSHKNKYQEYSFPKQSLVAKETNLNIKTVQRSIKVLVEKGFIVIEKMKAILGHFNKYKLLYVACMEAVKAKKEAKINNKEPIVKTVEVQENREFNVNKILEFTKIKKISEKQRKCLSEFDIVTINQTIAKIKSGITKMPRTATLLIAKVCDTAVGLGRFSEWQYKKYGLLKPINHVEEVVESKYEFLEEELLGWV